MEDIPASYVRFLPISKTWGGEWDTTAATMQWIYRWWTCNLSFPCIKSLVSRMNETWVFVFFYHEKMNHPNFENLERGNFRWLQQEFFFLGVSKMPYEIERREHRGAGFAVRTAGFLATQLILPRFWGLQEETFGVTMWIFLGFPEVPIIFIYIYIHFSSHRNLWVTIHKIVTCPKPKLNLVVCFQPVGWSNRRLIHFQKELAHNREQTCRN